MSTGTTSGIAFTKGHGTQNDFVVLEDRDAHLDLTENRVRTLCDRRAGLGADGVLRVATAGALLERGILSALPDGVAAADWFMDYRNADGSVAEMCGNGVRVFAHYLRAAGLTGESRFVVGSRAGARPVIVHDVDDTDAQVTVDMGPVRLTESSSAVLDGCRWTGTGVDVGNPHLACVPADLDAAGLAALDLTRPPEYDHTVFPHGVNLEIVTPARENRVHMRVFERGVGETRSCGTGTVAAAAAALRADGRTDGELTVTVPGGDVVVRIDDGHATLRGPSVLLASGTLSPSWWAGLAEADRTPHASQEMPVHSAPRSWIMDGV